MKNILEKLKQYLFAPRWHFSRFEFNLLSMLFISAGLIGGVYLTLSKAFPDVFAINDTTKTWTFNSAGASGYTYDATLVTVDNSGARPVTGVNKITN